MTSAELDEDTTDDPATKDFIALEDLDAVREDGELDREAVELEAAVDDPEESGPVYEEDEIVDVVPPIPKLMVLVLAEGATDDRLVEYDELG